MAWWRSPRCLQLLGLHIEASLGYQSTLLFEQPHIHPLWILQSSVSVRDISGDPNRKQHKGLHLQGERAMAEARSIPAIHPSWVLPFFPAYKMQNNQSFFPLLFLPCLTSPLAPRGWGLIAHYDPSDRFNKSISFLSEDCCTGSH